MTIRSGWADAIASSTAAWLGVRDGLPRHTRSTGTALRPSGCSLVTPRPSGAAAVGAAIALASVADEIDLAVKLVGTPAEETVGGKIPLLHAGIFDDVAAAAPWRGVNAADAVTLAYQAIGLLRQQLRSDRVVSFVILEGGQPANIIPAHARAVRRASGALH